MAVSRTFTSAEVENKVLEIFRSFLGNDSKKLSLNSTADHTGKKFTPNTDLEEGVGKRVSTSRVSSWKAPKVTLGSNVYTDLRFDPDFNSEITELVLENFGVDIDSLAPSLVTVEAFVSAVKDSLREKNRLHPKNEC